MSEIILCNLSDANSILEDKRNEWVHNILESLGIPDDVVYCQNVFQFRAGLNEYGIIVQSRDNNEEIDIYKLKWHGTKDRGGWLPTDKKYLIAQWKQPKRIKKVEGKNVYYELHTNEWSMVKSKIKGGA